MKTINGLLVSTLSVVLMTSYYITGVLPAPWETQQDLCDSNGNCIPEWFGRAIPITFFSLIAISVVLSALDALKPEDFPEKLESLAHTFSAFLPRAVGALLVVLFTKEWSLLLFLLVLIANSVILYLLKKKEQKKTFTLVSSSWSSLMVPVTMKPDISSHERGIAEELEQKDKIKSKQSLGLLTILNTFVTVLIISGFVVTLHFSDIKTNKNNYLSPAQMLEIFWFIFLPGCALSVICSLLIYFFPTIRLKGKKLWLKMILDAIIITVAVLIPIMSGIHLVRPGPQSAFIFVKVKYICAIYTL